MLLLCSNAIVLVQEIQKGALGFLQRSIRAGFQISKVREDTFFKLLRVLHGTTESLESKRKASHDVGTRYMEQVIP